MKELEKAMKIAQAAYDKTLFEAAVGDIAGIDLNVSPIENNKKRNKKTSRLEELETKLSGIDESSLFGDLYDDFTAYEIMMLFEEEDELLNDELFVNPNKEARRKTRKENRTHKTYDVCGNRYKRYGKDKKVGKIYREERLYSNGFGIKKTAVPIQEYDNDLEIPALADADKGEYRIINGYAYPSDYITDAEHNLIIQASRMSEYGHTDTGKICGIIFFAEISNDGRGFLTVKVMTEAEILYQGKDIERAKEIFNVLTKNN